MVSLSRLRWNGRCILIQMIFFWTFNSVKWASIARFHEAMINRNRMHVSKQMCIEMLRVRISGNHILLVGLIQFYGCGWLTLAV